MAAATSIRDVPPEIARLIVQAAREKPAATCEVRTLDYAFDEVYYDYIFRRNGKTKLHHYICNDNMVQIGESWSETDIARNEEAIEKFADRTQSKVSYELLANMELADIYNLKCEAVRVTRDGEQLTIRNGFRAESAEGLRVRQTVHLNTDRYLAAVIWMLRDIHYRCIGQREYKLNIDNEDYEGYDNPLWPTNNTPRKFIQHADYSEDEN